MCNRYLSDIISEEEIKQWDTTTPIIIQAPTGSGKSYMIKNDLYNIAKDEDKKILILVNRAVLRKEFEMELTENKKSDIIDVMTYQTLEAHYKKNYDFLDLEYDYIVCDECHYFFNDSSFNKFTQISYDTVNNSNAVKIFMSATANNIVKWFDNKGDKTKLYKIEPNYDYIDVIFFNKKLYIYDLLTSLKGLNQKCIVFMQDIELAYEIFRMFESDSLFLCSSSNKEYYKHVDTDRIDEMLKNNKFDSLFLITTTVFENGNTLKDKDLNHMIISLNDIETIQQCIGRKRLDYDYPDDYLNVAIWNLNNQAISGLLSKQRRTIEGAEILLKHGEKEYVKRYSRDYDPVVFDVYEDNRVQKRINEFLFYKSNQLIDYYSKWLNDKYHKGFKREIIGMLNKTWNEMYKFDEDEMKGRISLEEYLNSLVGKENGLNKKEQEILIEKIGLKNPKGRLVKSISLLNNYFEEEGIGYSICSGRIRIDGKQVRIWRIKKKYRKGNIKRDNKMIYLFSLPTILSHNNER